MLLHYTYYEGYGVLNERELVEKAKTSNDAFGELFDLYYQRIFGYIFKRVADAEVAQDIAAEVFIKAYQNINSFTWRGVSFGNWLYAIAGNELRMHIRKQQKAPLSLQKLFDANGYEPEGDINLQQELQNVQEAAERHSLFLEAAHLLHTLPVKYQEVVSLRFGEHMKLQDIAQVLGKKEGTVKSLLSRGLKLLRKELEVMQPKEPNRIIYSEGGLLTRPQELYEE